MLSLLWSTNFCHLFTTSSMVGRFLGSCCQQRSRSFHISPVSPTSRAFPGISGLSPCSTREAAVVAVCLSNGTLPVKISTANIAKANTSAGFDSITGTPPPPQRGLMISGANHLEVPTAPGVAATKNLGSELMGANPYSVNRAWPFRSIITFVCYRGISTMIEREIATPHVWQLKCNPKIKEMTYPLQTPMRDIERMQVLKSFCNIKQLRRTRKAKSAICCRPHDDQGLPYQRRSRCTRMRRRILANVTILLPVINERGLKECRVHPAKLQDVFMG